MCYDASLSNSILKLRATNSLNDMKIPHMTNRSIHSEWGWNKRRISSSFRRVYSAMIMSNGTVDINDEKKIYSRLNQSFAYLTRLKMHRDNRNLSGEIRVRFTLTDMILLLGNQTLKIGRYLFTKYHNNQPMGSSDNRMRNFANLERCFRCRDKNHFISNKNWKGRIFHE